MSAIHGMGAAGNGGSYSPSHSGIAGNKLTPSPQNIAEKRARRTCAGSAYVTMAQCESGHTFAKGLYCGKEWCPKCGADGSAAHKRRVARVLYMTKNGKQVPRVMQIKSMGYFVVEFPDGYRQLGRNGDEMDAWCYSKKDLNDTSKIVLDVLAGKRGAGGRGAKRKGGYFNRGLMRWHWFGDKAVTASGSRKWNPHLNVLVDGHHMKPEKLAEIKAALRTALNVPDLIIHYSYFDTPAKMYHKVKYITRSTFKNYDWNPYMARELYNFRNQRWWGSWNDEPAWGVDALDKTEIDGLLDANKLESGICPDCGRPLKTLYHAKDGHAVKWSRAVEEGWLKLWNAQEMGGTGYYRIPPHDWHGEAAPVHSVYVRKGLQIGRLLMAGREVIDMCTGEVVTARKELKKAENEAWWEAVLHDEPEIF